MKINTRIQVYLSYEIKYGETFYFDSITSHSAMY